MIHLNSLKLLYFQHSGALFLETCIFVIYKTHWLGCLVQWNGWLLSIIFIYLLCLNVCRSWSIPENIDISWVLLNVKQISHVEIIWRFNAPNIPWAHKQPSKKQKKDSSRTDVGMNVRKQDCLLKTLGFRWGFWWILRPLQDSFSW